MTANTGEQEGRRGGLPEDDSLDAFSAMANAATAPRRRRRAAATPEPEVEPPTPEPAAASAAEIAPEQQPAADAKPETEQRLDAPGEPEPRPEPEPQPEPARTALVPQPSPNSERLPSPAIEQDLAPAPAADHQVTTVPIKNLGEAGQRATQCTIMVSTSVRDRFAHYQLTKKMEGREPTNAIVVRRAVLHARKNDLFSQLLEKVRHRQQPVDDEDHDPDGIFGEVPGRRAERGRMKDSVQQSFRPSYQELEVIDTITAAYRFPSRSDFLDAALDAFLPPLPASGRSRTR
ncbi:hypothetical protein ACFV2X_38155 [Streptomyces sp. NPDC059679]|uniref:hypothetical protein n=1 Tax=Streptomyces sp. NPDC059679 TaxID=3346903 RepID=UPI0036986A97